VPTNLSMTRFGWIQAAFTDSVTGQAVPFVQAQASWTDPKTQTPYSTNDNADLHGFLNLTAPFGSHVLVNATAPDYNATAFYAQLVNASNTSFPGGTGVHKLGSVPIDSVGWVAGPSLNYTLLPPPI